ncbi:hypothetical protein FRC17_010458 [Serendipita sp. 399]|nr:hypothetical protein FRC17_010458 [Serendipita sp. 399]
MSSQNPYAGWTTSKLIPSVIFILTPVVAVGLLVTWSLRFHRIRRQILEGAGPSSYARRRQGLAGDVRQEDAPKLAEIWLGESCVHTDDERRKASDKIAIGYVMDPYRWEEILPFTLSPNPDSKLDEAKRPTQWQLGTIIRMPSQLQYGDIAHMDVTDLDFQLGILPVSCLVPR